MKMKLHSVNSVLIFLFVVIGILVFPEMPLAESSQCPQKSMEEVSMEIGPEGGTIHLSFSTLTIPEGALDSKVLIKFLRYGVSKNPDRNDYYEILPFGIKFHRSVTLSVVTGDIIYEGSELKTIDKVYPEDYRFCLIRDDGTFIFWRLPTQVSSQLGVFIGVLKETNRYGIRKADLQNQSLGKCFGEN
ncbi:MAG: hypothetical protein LBM75_06780 [Myxococcales bacterium]|jgi:hypothetical protein|nr:hypothetical protein [Myxococcales bacterium]